jgi:acyl-coenzyme A synthetase/AMP-(fatty) acid ligase
MTPDFIAFHAVERPDAVALVDQGREITYSVFSGDIGKFLRSVREIGVPRGGTVAVGCDDLYVHWLLLLAFEALGIATVSFTAGERETCAPLLASVDLVLSEPHFPNARARRHHAVTRQWVDSIFALAVDEEHLPPQTRDDPVRILRTSGTTGTPKRLAHTRHIHEFWITRWVLFAGLTNRSRLLLTMPFTVNGMYACATACLLAGGTVVSPAMRNAGEIARAISDYRISVVILVPIQIKEVLSALPDGFAKPSSLTICSFGAAVPEALRSRALTLLATDLIDMYGSNEAGFISSMRSSRENGIGAVRPGVSVQIVDEQDSPLSWGQLGRIRVKTAGMAQAYVNDPEATRRMFKDGWFYPGDLGVLHGPHQLQVVGRGDDLLNFGGNKFWPEVLEQVILKHAAAGEVGVCSLRNTEGVEQLYVGIVDPGYDDRELLERLNRALSQARIGRFHIVKLPRIPRNANGKVQRDLLRSTIADALGFPRQEDHP